MFRTAVLRAARLSRVATVSKAGVTGLGPVLRVSGASRVASLGMVMPMMAQLAAKSRFYSSDAAEATEKEQESEPEKAAGEITRFADLKSLGVHVNLVRSLTDTLGYDTMTPVQSATIEPALSGKDV